MSDVIDVIVPRKYLNLIPDAEADHFLREVFEEAKRDGKPISIKDLKKIAEAKLKDRFGI